VKKPFTPAEADRQTFSDTRLDLHRTITEQNDQVKEVTEKIQKLVQRKAQAESDKIEIMRDIATYEVNMSDSLEIQKTFQNWHTYVKETIHKINKVGGDNDSFLE
jgi:hypothetical protein